MIHDNSDQADVPVNASEDDSLRVGAAGWLRSDTQGFYPEDLPADWQPGFYANEFRTVLVDLDEIPQDEDELEAWLDVPEGFRFYVRVGREQAPVQTPQQTIEPLPQAIVDLGERLAGVTSVAVGEVDKSLGLALIEMKSRNLREWRSWLEQQAGGLKAVILCDEDLAYSSLSDFRSLVELMNL